MERASRGTGGAGMPRGGERAPPAPSWRRTLSHALRRHLPRRRRARAARDQRRPRDLPRHRAHRRDHQARRRQLLPRRRRRDHARAVAAADHARALAQGRARGHRRLDAREGRRRRLLPEAHPQGRARLRRDRADPVPLRPPRRRDLADRGRGRRLGRADGDDHVPPVAGARRRRRPPRRAAPRPRPAAGHRLRGRRPRRRRGADAARRPRLHRLPEDLGRAWRAHLRPHRAALDVHRRPPRRDRLRARARAAPARRGDDEVVEGGARRADLRRLQPERPRPDDRLRLQRPAEAGRAGLGAGDVGRARRGRARGLHRRDDAGALRRGRRPARRDRRHRPLAAAAARHVRASTRPATCRIRPTTRRCRASRSASSPRATPTGRATKPAEASSRRAS